MSLFKNLFKNPIKGITRAVASGGLSIVSPKIGKLVDPLAKLYVSPQVALAALSGGASLPLTGGGGSAMSLNIGGLLGNIGGILGGSSNKYISNVGQFAGLASQFIPQASSRIPSAPPGIGGGGGVMVSNNPVRSSGANLTQEVFNAGLKVLNRIGISYPATAGGFARVLKRSISSMASLARRTPTGTIVSLLAGLGLTAYESTLLVAWHAQRKKGRRMNPANSKALRRAARRIKGFHRLCQHTDLIRTGSRARYRSTGRCKTCRKSPCSC